MPVDRILKSSLPHASLVNRVTVKFFPGLNLWASLEDGHEIEFDVYGEYGRKDGGTVWKTHLVRFASDDTSLIAEADFPSGSLSKALAHSLSNYTGHKEFRRRGNSGLLEPGELMVRRITEDLYEGLPEI